MKRKRETTTFKKTMTIVLLLGFVMGVLTVSGCQQQEPTWLDEQKGESTEY